MMNDYFMWVILMKKINLFILLVIMIFTSYLTACSNSDSASGTASLEETEELYTGSYISEIYISYTKVSQDDLETDDLVYHDASAPYFAVREGGKVRLKTKQEYEDVYISFKGETVEEAGDLGINSYFSFTAEESGMYIIYATVDGHVKNITEDFIVSTVVYTED